MRIKIITLANQRPDFIELQLNSIKKFITDLDIEYIVFNTANNTNKSREIDAVCKKLSIQTIKVVKSRFVKFIDYNVSRTVARNLNWITKNYIKHQKDIVVVIDSDMFFIKQISIMDLIGEHNFVFVPAYRGPEFNVLFPWTGLMFFNLNTLPHPEKLNWDVGKILGHKVDVGGMNHFYLKKYQGALKILYLSTVTIQSIEIMRDLTRTIDFSINGNLDFIINTTKDNNLINIQQKNSSYSSKKSFPHQKESEDYDNFILKNFIAFESFLKSKNLNFPNPLHIDLIKKEGENVEDSFLFHYKAGSNYISYYTNEYNKKKTKELQKLLNL